MDIFITGTRALTLLREARRNGRAPFRNETYPAVSASDRWTFPAKRLANYAPVALSDISRAHPLETLVRDHRSRVRMKGIRCRICGVAREGSFVRVDPPNNNLVSYGLPSDLRLYCDSPARAFLVAAELLTHMLNNEGLDRNAALLRLMSLGSELCGTYARDARNPRGGEVAYGLAPLTDTSEIRRYLAECDGERGVSLARNAASYLVDGLRSPLEAEFYYALTLPPRMGGISFPAPLVNTPLPMGDSFPTAEGDRVPHHDTHCGKWHDAKRGAQKPLTRHARTHHNRLTPDMQWKFAGGRAAIEIDGRQFHGDPIAFADDRLRDQDYELLGCRVLRATYENVATPEALEDFIELLLRFVRPMIPDRELNRLRRNLERSRGATPRKTLVSVFGARLSEAPTT